MCTSETALWNAVVPSLGCASPFGRIVVVLVCYLDDSGTDKANPLVTMAGYLGALPVWAEFETLAVPLLRERGITCLHAKEFFSTRGQFEGWSRREKTRLLSDLYTLLQPRVGMAVSFSTLKRTFNERKRELGRSFGQSPYGFCFNAILNAIVRDEGVKRAIALGTELSFVIEEGNRNNAGVMKAYQNIKMRHPELDYLASMSFVDKKNCVAIQVADFFAFFTRRHACAMEMNGRQPVAMDPYLQIMRLGIRDIGQAATDFEAG